MFRRASTANAALREPSRDAGACTALFEALGGRVREEWRTVTYGTATPQDLVLQWLSELSGVDVLGLEVDALNTSLLRGLLAGLSFQEICDGLSEEYSAGEVAAQRQSLREQYDRIRTHAPLRPLFTERRVNPSEPGTHSPG